MLDRRIRRPQIGANGVARVQGEEDEPAEPGPHPQASAVLDDDPLDELPECRHGRGEVLRLVALLQLLRVVDLDEKEGEAVLLAGLDLRPPVADGGLHVQGNLRRHDGLDARAEALRVCEHGRLSLRRRLFRGNVLCRCSPLRRRGRPRQRRQLPRTDRGYRSVSVGFAETTRQQAGTLLLCQPLHVEVDQWSQPRVKAVPSSARTSGRNSSSFAPRARTRTDTFCDLPGSIREDDCLHFFSHSSA